MLQLSKAVSALQNAIDNGINDRKVNIDGVKKQLETIDEKVDYILKQLLIEQLRMKHWNLSFLTVKMSRLELIGRTAMIKKKRLNC